MRTNTSRQISRDIAKLLAIHALRVNKGDVVQNFTVFWDGVNTDAHGTGIDIPGADVVSCISVLC